MFGKVCLEWVFSTNQIVLDKHLKNKVSYFVCSGYCVLSNRKLKFNWIYMVDVILKLYGIPKHRQYFD
jgi:hypothetical protein